MIGKMANASTRPNAQGISLNSSLYGQAIPMRYGRCLGTIYQIWANGFRKGDSGKKGKKAGKKGMPPTYVENIDFLIGQNPIIAPLSVYSNQSDQHKLSDAMYAGTIVGFGTNTVTIPDPDFYAVIGCTFPTTYSFAVNDYGGVAQTLSGSYEVPMWNTAFAGPDFGLIYPHTYWPFVYRWVPGSGPTVTFPSTFNGDLGGTVNIYYVKKTEKHFPLAYMRLEFEPVLGTGSEYSGYSSQQLTYKHYAGVGSPNFDLGFGMMPNVRMEILGTFPKYSTGDADFADMIQDIIRSGIIQTGYTAGDSYSSIQRGLNCFNMPGIVQSQTRDTVYSSGSAVTSELPVTAGNWILFWSVGYFPGSGVSLSDTAGTVYTKLFDGPIRTDGSFTGFAYVWIGQVTATTPNNHFVVANPPGNDNLSGFVELAGVDTFEGYTVNQIGTGSVKSANGTITCGGVIGRDAYVMGLCLKDSGGFPGYTKDQTTWDQLLSGHYFTLQGKHLVGPSTQSVEMFGNTDPSVTVMLSFTNSQPVDYPKALGDILDRATLNLSKSMCQAYGLWGSLSTDSQRKGSEWLKDLYEVSLTAPVWSGFVLKSIPYGEVSWAGNGAQYTSPTASGPLVLKEQDFIDMGGGKMVTVEHRVPTIDDPNILQYQHPNRAGQQYAETVTAEPQGASVSIYGPKKQSPVTMRCIQDPAIARKVLSVQGRRRNMLTDTFKFKLKPYLGMLEAMDFIQIPDQLVALDNQNARLTKVKENADGSLDCEAEPWIYGLHFPAELPITTAAPYNPNTNVEVASVNAPVFLEPVPALYNNQNQQQLWIGVSDADTNYGGCIVMCSTDGGASYNQIGDPIQGNATTGVLAGTWPTGIDPDTVNDLLLDLTESNGALNSYTTTDENNLVYPCYVQDGSSDIPYELMTYATATLTSAYHYTLKAAGTGNFLRRGIRGTPIVSHASGKRFLFLDPTSVGIFKITMDPLWIGKTLHFKFLAFNKYGGGVQDITDPTVLDYTYAPTGTTGAVNPNGNPSQVFLVNGSGAGDSTGSANAIINIQGDNTSAYDAYNKTNFPLNFTGTSVVTVAGATVSVDPNVMDDSQNPVTPAHVSNVNVQSLFTTNPSMNWGVHATPWFGSQGHVQIGVNCNTDSWVSNFINQLVNCGFKWVALYWKGTNGASAQFLDGVMKRVQAKIATLPSGTMKFLPMVDKSTISNATSNALALAALTSAISYLQTNYLSDPNIFTFGGKPIIQFFDTQVIATDAGMTSVKAATTGSSAIWMPNGSGSRAQSWCDACYDWPQPWTTGVPGVDKYNTAHIGTFLTNMIASGKPYMCTLYKAFNGTLTRKVSWSEGKDIPHDWGTCFLTTASYNDAHIDSNCIAPMIATWNDWEEGTAIEPGIDNKVSVSASISGTNVNWTVTTGTGDESTIQHYTVWASTNGFTYTSLGNVLPGVGTFSLAGMTSGQYSIMVQAVGKPCFRCADSSILSYTV